VVALQFKGPGAIDFEEFTGRNVGKDMAIVLDDLVMSAPRVNERIAGGRAQITLGAAFGQDLMSEANNLVVVLKSGALPARLRPSNEQMIGPTLGPAAVRDATKGAMIGIGIILVFMLLYYQVGGLVADVMVLVNLLLQLAIMAFFEATLTLPGIAATALTVGMSIDANVLITERIREELRAGRTARAAVDQGFDRAFWSIFDGQITTLIAGVVLFQFGTGPIKGFSVMLMIGMITSLFTGIFCSKVVLEWYVRGLKRQHIPVG
jgi:preprotein translocase subunit SecD